MGVLSAHRLNLCERINNKLHSFFFSVNKDCLSSMIPSAAAAAAYWPYLYTRCNPATTTNVSRRKGGQIRFSAEQSLQLEKKFEISQYLSPVERKQIAKSLQLSERQVRK